MSYTLKSGYVPTKKFRYVYTQNMLDFVSIPEKKDKKFKKRAMHPMGQVKLHAPDLFVQQHSRRS